MIWPPVRPHGGHDSNARSEQEGLIEAVTYRALWLRIGDKVASTHPHNTHTIATFLLSFFPSDDSASGR